MAAIQNDVYRLVPYRFFLAESKADICRLEQLTNLFPDMKPLIELELFKINNLSRMIDRLSNIYTIVTAMHTKDDTMHIFLGPYHLSLGPTSFGAFQFKNISKALLASASSKTSKLNEPQQQKRRHDAAFRRFRRAVRKLILIRSIIDQLRFASVLTPFNQYELRTAGIYDLVLAGHVQNSRSAFDDDYFLEQSEINPFEKETTLLMSRYIKINSLLTLLSPNPQQSDKQATTEQRTSTNRSNDTDTKRTNSNQSQSLMNLTTLCCSHHINDMPPIMLPKKQSASHQSMHHLTVEPHVKHHKRRSSNRSQSTVSKASSVASLPDLNIDDDVIEDPLTVPTNASADNLENSVALSAHTPSQELPSSEEDAFIDRVSSLFKTCSLSHQSPTLPSNCDDDDAIVASSADASDQLSSENQYEKLFQRIKTVFEHQVSATSNHRYHQQQSMPERNVSFQDTIPDERRTKHSIFSNKPSTNLNSVDQNNHSAFLTVELPSNSHEADF